MVGEVPGQAIGQIDLIFATTPIDADAQIAVVEAGRIAREMASELDRIHRSSPSFPLLPLPIADIEKAITKTPDVSPVAKQAKQFAIEVIRLHRDSAGEENEISLNSAAGSTHGGEAFALSLHLNNEHLRDYPPTPTTPPLQMIQFWAGHRNTGKPMEPIMYLSQETYETSRETVRKFEDYSTPVQISVLARFFDGTLQVAREVAPLLSS